MLVNRDFILLLNFIAASRKKIENCLTVRSEVNFLDQKNFKMNHGTLMNHPSLTLQIGEVKYVRYGMEIGSIKDASRDQSVKIILTRPSSFTSMINLSFWTKTVLGGLDYGTVSLALMSWSELSLYLP